MTAQELSAREKQQVQGQEKTRAGRYFLPDVDIYEGVEAIHLRADMPGVKDQDVGVTLENGVLTIEGKVVLDMYQDLSPLYTEYNVGNYFRQFELGETLDESKISAKMKDGVLELELPKAEAAKPRRIEVKVG
ncbi:MAG: Hsp20/alpha crystallin family protein [Candidatus Binataceae bacterium]|jgi:HSP20 family protein